MDGMTSQPRAGVRRPRVYIIGLGIPELKAMSLEARAAMETCRTLFVNDPDHRTFRQYCQDVRPIGDFGVGWEKRRMDSLVARVLAASKKGPVGLTVYGHPMIYEPLGHHLLKACRRRKVPVAVISGVSAFDSILSALGLSIGLGEAVQFGDAAYFAGRGPDPRSTVIVYQAFQELGKFRRIMAQCLKVYPASHKVAAVEAGSWAPERIAWSTLGSLSKQVKRPKLYASLLIPPCR